MEVKCRHCGRKLTDPESRERGYGPKCWAKVTGREVIHRMKKIPGQVSIFDFPEVTDEAMAKSEMKTCPVCGEKYTRVGCLSRKDNKTTICEACGAMEALDAARIAYGPNVNAGKFEEMKAEIIKIIKGGVESAGDREHGKGRKPGY